MTKKIDYESTPEFEKDFKKLEKRYRTLEKDFDTMKKYTLETHYLEGAPTTAFIPIEGFCTKDYQSIKVKKFACIALKKFGNRSGIRVIYVFEPAILKVTFIEIYYKGDKANEDRERLKKAISYIN